MHAYKYCKIGETNEQNHCKFRATIKLLPQKIKNLSGMDIRLRLNGDSHKFSSTSLLVSTEEWADPHTDK